MYFVAPDFATIGAELAMDHLNPKHLTAKVAMLIIVVAALQKTGENLADRVLGTQKHPTQTATCNIINSPNAVVSCNSGSITAPQSSTSKSKPGNDQLASRTPNRGDGWDGDGWDDYGTFEAYKDFEPYSDVGGFDAYQDVGRPEKVPDPKPRRGSDLIAPKRAALT